MMNGFNTHIYLYDSREEAIVNQKRHCEGGISFGCTFTTLQDLTNEIWQLYGSGKQIISNEVRQLILIDLLQQNDLSLKAFQIIGNFIDDYSYYLSQNDVLTKALDNENVNLEEKKILSTIKDYFNQIHRFEFVEIGETFEIVSKNVDESILDTSNLKICDLSFIPLYKLLNIQIPQIDFQNNIDSSFEDLDFLISFGQLATNTLITKKVAQLISNQTSEKKTNILIATDDPFSIYAGLNCSSEFDEISIQVKTILPISSSSIGKFVLGALKLIAKREIDIAMATDVAQSPYFGRNSFSMRDIHSLSNYLNDDNCDNSYKASDLNTIWRADRSLFTDDIREDCLSLSPVLNALNDLFNDNLTDEKLNELFQFFEKQIYLNFDSLDKSKELAALNKIKNVLNNALTLTTHTPDANLVYECLSCASFSMEAKESRECDTHKVSVMLMSLGYLSSLPSKYFDFVIVNDASEQSFNSKETTDPLDALKQLMNLPLIKNRADLARINFVKTINSSKSGLSFVLPLRNNNFDEIYPSFVLDEFLSFKYSGISAKELIDNKCQSEDNKELLENLQKNVYRLGEEDIVVGIAKNDESPIEVYKQSSILRGSLDPTSIDHLLTHESTTKKIVLSPSAIEKYMSCPYSWFLERKISIGSLDESLGYLEAGLFAHSIMEGIYTSLMESGVKRVDDISEEQLQKYFDKVFEDVLAEQKKKFPLSGRYIPINTLEEIELKKLKKQIWNSLILHKDLPKDFEIDCVEYNINPFEDKNPSTLEYAGVLLNGRIDRVDINEEDGQFYILDYKRSVSQYNAGSSQFTFDDDVSLESKDEQKDQNQDISSEDLYPEHIQAIIYATVLQKIYDSNKRNLSCVGALYTPYTAHSSSNLVAGSIALDSDSGKALSNLSNKKSFVTGIDGGFNGFLNKVEQIVRAYTLRIEDGDIEPSPRSKASCTYCPYRECSRRL